MTAPLGFAVVGTGSVAATHALALRRVAGARLLAAWSPDPARCAAFARTHGIDAAGDLGALIRRDDVDVVCVTTPSGLHAESALAALAAGKHVVCEKPIEVREDRIDAMIAVAARHGRRIACVFQNRFAPGARALKAAVDAGRFGRLALCQAMTNWWRDDAYYRAGGWRGTWDLDGGGALMNQGIHGVDLLQWMVGMPSEVLARTARCAHDAIEVEDTAVAALRFPCGALGSIQASTASWPGFSRRIEISGDRGCAVLEDDRLVRWEFMAEESGDADLRALPGIPAPGGNAQTVAGDGHRRQLQEVVDALREGRQPPVAPDEARESVRVVLAIYRSARSGDLVRLQPSPASRYAGA
ncbi:MAG TPA: Gfo/Idh/MocA family oxidoreductase [Planctomycetota bacterium]|nr:Gfo/Idh/MocA family oxidoreductase [Planctomycetota bacterium]